MSRRSVFSTVVIVLAAWTASGMAQETLGDLVDAGGYGWIIGRWVASTDEGQKVEFNFEWAVDKRAVLNSLRMGDFQYQGIITMSPADQGAIDLGADSRGGTWKGAWSQEGDGLVREVEHTGPDGQARKGDIVYTKVDADTITVAIYAVESSGRSAEPWNKLTYKRQSAKAAPVKAAGGTTERSTDYQKLGDVVASGGYEWLIGKWVSEDKSKPYELEYKSILDQHACTADLKSGEFKYSGMIIYVASRQEIQEFGVDTMGRIWKGVWGQEGSDAVSKSECTTADGTTVKLQHVFTKIDNDTFKGKLYAIGADGNRGAEPREQVTFKRQKPAASTK